MRRPVTIDRKKYATVIGIDPGVTTGLSIWDRREKKFRQIGSCLIHKAMDIVNAEIGVFDDATLVRIEDARLRKWIPKERDIRQVMGRAKGAGSVSRDCKIWEDFLEDLGVDYEMVPPKNNKTKVDAKLFKAMTGWTGQTNEHARDSAMLIYQF